VKRNPHEFIAEMDNRAAELTEAAFRIALSSSGTHWLDHKLHLWDAMKHVVYRWEHSERSGHGTAAPPVSDHVSTSQLLHEIFPGVYE
jgi:hypothetical protein